ncbi:PucR family transcriptional regulator [Streptomyces armeniacus]|uniref:PucR family transcriptional regulator n=1 Tax=Streptomyces armeniacus TaxID=83291 RepID=A0A345XS53_9ACTN|nr:PucR family transcriptional regulator [Streptomyces armeniacus]AXK34469.1 PucR family transcriptional regulator [Streptomyces armeniacus]
MAPTLRWLLHRGELRLRALVDAADERTVRWVHVSELADPTAYLAGGELLLTTGLHTSDRDWDGYRAYVGRLAAHGVSALGFGVGLTRDEVPDELVEAAREAGVPLLRVPRPTPFIAISEAVAGAIARTHEEVLTSALKAQRDLIGAALSTGGPRAVVGELAAALGCWVLLLDRSGAARHGAPPDARRHAARIRHALDRLSPEARDTTAHAVSLDAGGDQVSVLPVGAGGRVTGHLAAGRKEPLGPAEQAVIAGAVGLLSLDTTYQEQTREAQRRTRLAVLRLAAGAHAELAESTADTLGVPLPSQPLRVAVLGCEREDMPELLRAAEEHLALSQAGALIAPYDTYSVVVLLPEAQGDQQALEEVLHRVPGARGAVSEAAPLSEVPDALRRARSVFYGTTGDSARLVLAKDVVTAGLLAQLDNPGAQGWADALLEPLERHAVRSKLDLISTLRVYLAHNGHIDASSTALGIHRHTLRYRLDRITELLDHDLENPTARAELWLALLLREAR